MSEPQSPPTTIPRRSSIFSESMRRRREEIAAMRRAVQSTRVAPLEESQSPIDYLAFEDDPRVYYICGLISLTRNANEALLLSQFIYWFHRAKTHPSDGRQLSRARAEKDGKIYLHKSHKALAYETGLSASKVKRALRGLKENGYIETARHRHDGKQANLIRLSDRCCEAVSGNVSADLGVKVHATTVRMTGDVESALVLSQLCYWASTDKKGRCRMRVFRDGHFWIAKTVEELASEVGLAPRRTRSALDRLTRQGLLIKSHHLFGGRRMLHLRMNSEVFGELWFQEKQREYSTAERA